MPYILLLILIAPFPALAFDVMSMIARPNQQKINVRYSSSLQPKTSLSSASESTALLQHNASASIPIYKTDDDSLIFNGRYQHLDLRPDQNLVPDFYDVQFGLGYNRTLGEKEMWSISANYGSASDKPFRDSSVSTVNSTLLYTYPQADSNNSWVLLLNYSNNRPFLNNVPLPGFAYVYVPSPSVRATFGIPFASVFWQWSERWSVTFFTLPPWMTKAQVAYTLFGPAQAFAGIDMSQLNYFKYGRINRKDRVYYDEKKIFAGFRVPLSRVLMSEFETGASFGRKYFTSENYETDPDAPIKLGSSAYFKVSLSGIF